MSFSLGIIGLPNVGKSTLFNALSSAKAEASNYPFCTINPNIGVVEVPDERLEVIQKIMGSAKAIPTIIEFHDIAGLVKGAHKGEGLGNQFLGNIRNVDALVHVVRCFADDNVSHMSGQVNPSADIEIIKAELMLADLATVEKRLEKTKIASKAGDKKVLEELKVLEACKEKLSQGQKSGPSPFTDLDLLTAKPVLYLANVDESGNPKQVEEVKKHGPTIALCSKLEAELKDLSPQEAQEFLAALGQKESGLKQFIAASYKLLNLITFFTANKKESRAWTLKSGSTVYQAAGQVHTDMQKGFISAEVAPYDKLSSSGSYQALKDRGQLQLVGREHKLDDGDLVLIRFNV